MNQVPVREKDYLEQDAPIRGQNYVCMSFVSPEDVIVDKNAFSVKKFLKSFSSSAEEAIMKVLDLADSDSKEKMEAIKGSYSYVFNNDKIVDAYEKFLRENAEKITKEFDSQNDFRTSVRGIKVRGCYETLDEAKNRGESLIKKDPKFHVFIGEVGCWCPWSPNPDEIKDEVFAETQLNTLVKEYKENIESRQAEYTKRKEEMTQKAMEEGRKGEGSGTQTQTTGTIDPETGEEIITVGGIETASAGGMDKASTDALEAADPWEQKVSAT